MAKGRSPQADGDGGKRKQLRKRLRKAEDQLADAQQKRDRAQARVEALAIIADEVRAQLADADKAAELGAAAATGKAKPAASRSGAATRVKPASRAGAAASPQRPPPRPSPAAGPPRLPPPAPPRRERRLPALPRPTPVGVQRGDEPPRAAHGPPPPVLRPGRHGRGRRRAPPLGPPRGSPAGAGQPVSWALQQPTWERRRRSARLPDVVPAPRAGHAYPICVIATPRARRNGRPVIRRQSGRKLRRKRSTSASRESR